MDEHVEHQVIKDPSKHAIMLSILTRHAENVSNSPISNVQHEIFPSLSGMRNLQGFALTSRISPAAPLPGKADFEAALKVNRYILRLTIRVNLSNA